MNASRLAAALLAVLFLAACASTSLTRDIEVETETDAAADLKAYQTYAWIGSAEIVNDPHGHWEPPALDADTEIRHLINTEMRDQGFVEVERDPDLLVGFAAGIDMAALELVDNPDTDMQTLENVPRGALLVVLIDASTRYAVWAGIAAGNVKSQRPAEETRKRLAYAVDEMFKQMTR